MTFTNTLKELAGKATKGPWARQSGCEPRIVCGPDRRQLFRCYQDNVHGNDPEANAALIVHLVNHAEDIVALVDAVQASLDRPQPDLVAVPGGGHTTRNLQEIVEFDSAARDRIQAALSRLEGKP